MILYSRPEPATGATPSSPRSTVFYTGKCICIGLALFIGCTGTAYAEPTLDETKEFIGLYATVRYDTNEKNCLLQYKYKDSWSEVDFGKINPERIIPIYSITKFYHKATDPGCFLIKGEKKIPVEGPECQLLQSEDKAADKVAKAIKHAAKLCGAKGVSPDLFK